MSEAATPTWMPLVLLGGQIVLALIGLLLHANVKRVEHTFNAKMDAYMAVLASAKHAEGFLAGQAAAMAERASEAKGAAAERAAEGKGPSVITGP